MKLFHILSSLAVAFAVADVQAQPVEITFVPSIQLSNHLSTGADQANDRILPPMANKTFEVAEKLQAVNFVGYFDQPDSLFQNMSKPVITEIAYNLTGQNWTSSVRLPNDYGTFAISRKEFDVLSKVGITGKQLYDIGSYYYMAYTIFSIECLGRTRTANGEAWYLKVKSSVWESVRKEVASVYLKAGGNEGAFDQNDFYPHITIGQTGNEDIPDEDIARGTNSTCVANVKLVGPPF